MSINREIRFITAGDSNSVSQVFYNNYLADSTPVKTNFFSFEKPMYYTYGGTLNYYSQDPFSIFTNLVRPPIRFEFSANTGSLSGESFFIHEIYRLDYDTYKLYGDNQISDSQEIINKSVSDTNVSNISNISNVSNRNLPASNAPTREKIGFSNIRMGNNPIQQPGKFFGEPLTSRDFGIIQEYLNVPILTISASTKGITGNIYDLYLSQFIKSLGYYKSELFSDKAQYFINTKLVFNVDLDRSYDSFYDNSVGLLARQVAWNNNLRIEITNNNIHSIQSGPFAGLNVIGNYFTYFIVPDKPKLEYPVMEGQLSTFTPEFRWSNGDRADSFLIQISYNVSDTGFTDTVFNYPVEKSEKNAQISKSTIKSSTEEYSTDKTIYTFQIPVKSNKNFIYRIGNSRELIDVFDVRRNVVTFSDYYSAISQAAPIKTYVVTESDSKYLSEIAGFSTPPSLDYESEISEYVLSGMVSGSTVTGATMQLTYPNSSFVTTTTDLTGYYSFVGLETGAYTLTTNYRGYQQDIRAINLTGNTTENFKMKLIWGNPVDTWGKLAGENYYT